MLVLYNILCAKIGAKERRGTNYSKIMLQKQETMIIDVLLSHWFMKDYCMLGLKWLVMTVIEN